MTKKEIQQLSPIAASHFPWKQTNAVEILDYYFNLATYQSIEDAIDLEVGRNGNIAILEWAIKRGHKTDFTVVFLTALSTATVPFKFIEHLLENYANELKNGDWDAVEVSQRLGMSFLAKPETLQTISDFFSELLQFDHNQMFNGFIKKFVGIEVQRRFWKQAAEFLGIKLVPKAFLKYLAGKSIYNCLPVLNADNLSFLHGLGFRMSQKDINCFFGPDITGYYQVFNSDYRIQRTGLRFIRDNYPDLFIHEMISPTIAGGNQETAMFLINNFELEGLDNLIDTLILSGMTVILDHFANNPQLTNYEKNLFLAVENFSSVPYLFDSWDGFQWAFDHVSIKKTDAFIAELVSIECKPSYFLFFFENGFPLPKGFLKTVKRFVDPDVSKTVIDMAKRYYTAQQLKK